MKSKKKHTNNRPCKLFISFLALVLFVLISSKPKTPKWRSSALIQGPEQLSYPAKYQKAFSKAQANRISRTSKRCTTWTSTPKPRRFSRMAYKSSILSQVLWYYYGWCCYYALLLRTTTYYYATALGYYYATTTLLLRYYYATTTLLLRSNSK